MKLLFAAALALATLTGAAMAKTEKAIVAGGCFWCVESDFEKVKGVKDVVSGYTGGSLKNPTYENHEGHFEAVEITFDNAVISYDQVIHLFLRSIDVTDAGGQFCDRGSAYKSAIFVSNNTQKASAKAAIARGEVTLGQKIVTPIKGAATFWKAEEYHQNYYKSSDLVITSAGPKSKKNAYKYYRTACGRDARVKQVWGSEAAFAH
jgi:peptide-methionine (S)-S-oxide reductase